jgi:hypothetical protein
VRNQESVTFAGGISYQVQDNLVLYRTKRILKKISRYPRQDNESKTEGIKVNEIGGSDQKRRTYCTRFLSFSLFDKSSGFYGTIRISNMCGNPMQDTYAQKVINSIK